MRMRWISLALLCAWVIGFAWPAVVGAAQAAPTFSLTVRSAYLRDGPAATAERTYSVFAGANYRVLGRTADSTWLRLDFAGATRGTWIAAAIGTVRGDLAGVPVNEGSAATGPSQPAPTAGPANAPAEAPMGSAAVTAGNLNQRLTITAKSTFVRDGPDTEANRVASLFKGAVVTAIGRDPDAGWIEILSGAPGWVPAGAGRLSGRLLDLPVSENLGPLLPPPGTAGAPPESQPPWIPVLTARMKQVYGAAGLHGRSPRAFTVAGDCNSESYLYLAAVAAGLFDFSGGNEYLWPTVLQFKGSFYRESLAVDGGFNSASVMDPAWANPQKCRKGESPFACELRVSRASVVFILLGTGDTYQWGSFEANYRKLIEYALKGGVLPVVVTKADALESQEGGAEPDTINILIRKLAAEYEVPLLDFSAATATLPNHGLLEEPGNDFHLSGEGVTMHIQATLQTLHAIWHP